jgi:hypothetical protein
VGRRRFEYLVVELSVALGHLVPRYPLWLRLHELGWNPEELEGDQLLAFYDGYLDQFLAEQGWALTAPSRRRIRRRLACFDPRHRTPYEIMEALGRDRQARS